MQSNPKFLRYHPHGGGGYEDVGAVEAINSMLLLSIEGGMRFFPAWPVGEAASFQNLRASVTIDPHQTFFCSCLLASLLTTRTQLEHQPY